MSRPTTLSCREIFTAIAAPPRTIRKAIGYYEEAIRLDPRYALAYAKLSIRGGNLATATAVLRTKKDKRRSQKPAPRRKARSSWIRISPRRIRHKARILRISISISPLRKRNSAAPSSSRRRMPGVTANLADTAVHLGRLDEAVALDAAGDCARSVTRRQPTPTSRRYLTALGRYDEAEAALRKAIELQPQSAKNYL